MITEEVSDFIKGGAAFGVPTVSMFGIPVQEWMYIMSLFAATLLVLERLPSVYGTLSGLYARFKK